MKQFITATVLLLSAVVFSFAQDKKASGPQFKFEDTKHNFGFVREGELVHMEYTFQNTGTQPILISEVKVTCGCTTPDFPKSPIKPGEKGIIKINFDTTGKYDRQDRTVDVISNVGGPPLQLRFKGVVLKRK
jgi:hypothetical protein